MASEHIEFKIGSSFSGEGFEKATQAINDNRKELTAARAGLGELKNAFASISPEAAKSVSAVESFTKAFVTGGIVGGAIQLAIQGCAQAVTFFAKQAEEMRERVEKLKESFKQAFIDTLSVGIDKVKDMNGEFDTMKRRADDLLGVLNGNVAHEAANEVYKINMEKLQAVTDALTAEEKAIVAAAYDHKIAMVKLTAAETQASNAVTTRSEQLDIALERQKKAHSSYEVALEVHTATMNDAKASEEERKAATDALTFATKELEAADYGVTTAQNKLLEATNKQEEAMNERTLQDKTLAAKEKELIEEKQRRIEEEEARAQAEEDAFDKMLEANYEHVHTIEALNESARKLKEAWDKEDKASGETKLATNVKVTNPQDIGSSMTTSVQPIRDDIQAPKRIDPNQVVPFKEAQREQRDIQRENRDAVAEIKGKFGTEFSNYFASLRRNQSETDKERIAYMESTVFPQLVKAMGVDMAAKFLGEQSGKVLMHRDLQEFFGGKDGKLVVALRECVKDLTAK